MSKLGKSLMASAFLVFFASFAYSGYLEYHRPLFPHKITPYVAYWKGMHAVIYITSAEYSALHTGFLVSAALTAATFCLALASKMLEAKQREAEVRLALGRALSKAPHRQVEFQYASCNAAQYGATVRF
jgi:hypothetical protein